MAVENLGIQHLTDVVRDILSQEERKRREEEAARITEEWLLAQGKDLYTEMERILNVKGSTRPVFVGNPQWQRQQRYTPGVEVSLKNAVSPEDHYILPLLEDTVVSLSLEEILHGRRSYNVASESIAIKAIINDGSLPLEKVLFKVNREGIAHDHLGNRATVGTLGVYRNILALIDKKLPLQTSKQESPPQPTRVQRPS